MPNILHMDFEVISLGSYESYQVAYFTEDSQDMQFESVQLGEVISFVHDNYRIEGVRVVLDETVAGQIISRRHIIDFIENNIEQLLKRIISNKINNENQN